MKAVLSRIAAGSIFLALTIALTIALAPEALAQLRPPPEPAENPLTPEKAILGKALFWDEQLGSDDTVACGTCHQPAFGGADPRPVRVAGLDGELATDDDVFGSGGVLPMDANGDFRRSDDFGFERQATGRFANTFLGAAWARTNFWDGRASTTFIDPQSGKQSIAVGGALESQAVGPPVSSVEMAHDARDWDQIAAKLAVVEPLALSPRLTPDLVAALAANPTYPDLFEAAFGTTEINSERIAFAIASYERSLVPDQTPWDRHARGEPGALSPDALAGLNLFDNVFRCTICHVPPLFSDDLFHNVGVRPLREDLGRSKVTGNPSDDGRFKTPSLRNVALRKRLMHNGHMGSLAEAIELYERGGDFPQNLDPLIQPIDLTLADKGLLIAFLTEGLTDPRVRYEAQPFDRPALRGEEPANPALFGESLAGSGGFVPRMLAAAPPFAGNGEFQLGIGDALGGAIAWLLLGSEAADDAHSHSRGFPVNVELVPAPIVVPVVLLGAGPGLGFATVDVPLPDDPALVGATGAAQWLVEDPGAPAGIAATQGAFFSIFG